MKYNNADTTFAGDLQASGSSFIVKTGEGDLFPPTGEAPYKVTSEHYEGEVVKKREILTISARTDDAFTVSARAVEICVQDESAIPKTRTQNALSFSSGDRVFMSVTEDDYNGIEDELNTVIPGTYVTNTVYDAEKVQQGTSSTGNDSYHATISTTTSYINGQRFQIGVDVSNTDSATFEVNSLGAKTIKIGEGGSFVDIPTNTITAGGFMNLTYIANGDFFQYTDDTGNIVSAEVGNLLQTGLVAGEDISSFNGFRVGQTSLAEDITKYYQAKEDTDKSLILGTVKDSVLSGNEFSGYIKGAVSGFADFGVPGATGPEFSGTEFITGTLTGTADQEIGQTFKVGNNQILSAISIYDRNAFSMEFVLDLYKNGVKISESDQTTAGASGVKKALFSDLVILEGGVDYEFRTRKISGGNFNWGYISAGGYTDGTRTIGGVPTTGDMYFIVDVFDILIEYPIGGNVFLQEDGSFSGIESNTKVGTIINSSTINIDIDGINGQTSTTATTGAVVLGNATEYLTIKVNGVDKKIALFDV